MAFLGVLLLQITHMHKHTYAHTYPHTYAHSRTQALGGIPGGSPAPNSSPTETPDNDTSPGGTSNGDNERMVSVWLFAARVLQAVPCTSGCTCLHLCFGLCLVFQAARAFLVLQAVCCTCASGCTCLHLYFRLHVCSCTSGCTCVLEL